MLSKKILQSAFVLKRVCLLQLSFLVDLAAAVNLRNAVSVLFGNQSRIGILFLLPMIIFSSLQITSRKKPLV